MRWLTKGFIQDAQESPLAGDIPKEKIPEVFRMVTTGVLRILSSKNEVIEMNEGQFPMYMRKARTYLHENSPEYRASITSASSGSSGVRSLLSNQSRTSKVSTNTGASTFSTGRQSDRTKRSATVPTTFTKLLGKPYMCPTCGSECKNPSGFAKHFRAFHERETTVFQCWYCEYTSEDQSDVQLHCRHDHPAYFTYVHVLPSFNKAAYGCSFCETVSSSLEMHLKCMERDQKKDPTLPPVPTKRLRALLGQSDVTLRAIGQACECRQLPLDAWKQFTWDDNTCDEYSRRLEYGCNGHDDIHRPGVDNIHQFIEQLLANAKFESTSRPVPPPVPPPKDATEDTRNIESTNDVPALNATRVNSSAGPGYQYRLNEYPGVHNQVPYPQNQYMSNPSNMAHYDTAMYHPVSGVEAAALQSNNQPVTMSRMIAAGTVAPQKRQPSLESMSHPDSYSRAKRHLAAEELALPEWNTDRPDSMVLPPHSFPSVRSNIEREVPIHPAPTAEEVEFGNDYGLKGFGYEQGYVDQPWDNGQDVFLDQQNFGAQQGHWGYINTHQQPYDNQQVQGNHRIFNNRHYDRRYHNHN